MKTSKNFKTPFQHTLFRTLSVGVVLLLLVGVVLSAPPTQPVRAAVVCTSTANGDWDGAIWSCAGGPTADDNIVIRHDVTLNADKSIASLSIETDQAAGTYFGSLQFLGVHTLTLSGNLNVDFAGFIDPGESTVAFAAGDQTITTNGQWVDFYNLTKASSGSLNFAPSAVAGQDGGGVHVLEKLTLKGASPVGSSPAAYLPVRSTTPGSAFQVWYEGSADIDFVDVKDAVNAVGTITATNTVDDGNNSGWIFGTGNAATKVALASSAKQGIINKAVTLTAIVTPLQASGKVTFFANGVDISACESIPVVEGKATCTVAFSALGSQIITSQYTAEEPFASATSNPINQVTVFAMYFLPALER